MADYRNVHNAFWHDEYTESLSANERLLYLYLFTNPHVNNAGVFKVTRKKMAFETGIDEVGACIDRLKEDGKLVEYEGYFWVVNFIKNQTTNSPKIAASILKLLDKIPEGLAAKIREKYPSIKESYRKAIDRITGASDTLPIGYEKGMDTVPIPSVEPKPELELESEENTSSPCNMLPPEPESKKSLPKSFLESAFKDEAYEFADWFRTITSESVKFDRDAWAQEWDKLRRIDGRKDKKEIYQAIEWARGDPFWSTNFHSPLKLRKRNDDGVMYIDLFIEKMKQHKRRNNATGTTQDGNPHAKANAAAIEALQRGDFAKSPAGVGNRSG